MREIRQSGSEGGESNLPYPYPAQGEVGEALGTMTAHDSALKGAVQQAPTPKPHRKQVNGPFRADEHSNTIPKALPWADRTGPTDRKIGIWKPKCSKRPVSICKIAQLQN